MVRILKGNYPPKLDNVKTILATKYHLRGNIVYNIDKKNEFI